MTSSTVADVADPAIAEITARTRETLALLRRLRRDHMRAQAGSAAFTAYAVVIVLFVYGGLLLPWLRRLSGGQHGDVDTTLVAAAAPPALIALVLLVLLAVLRDALWRGPVTLPMPATSWLLPMPISRGRLLRPRLRNQLVIGVVGGAVLGAALTVLLAAGGLAGTHFWSLLGVAVGALAAIGLLAVAAAALVERYPTGERLVRRLGPVAVLAVLGLAVQSGLAAYGHQARLLLRIETWSGPWGWAIQPMLASAGADHPGWAAPGWTAAIGALAVVAVAVTALAVVGCSGVPARTLRARARSVAGLTSGLVAMDPRAAALEIRAARGQPMRWLRLPAPHRAELIIAWRDATTLLRAPSRLAWSALLTVAGTLLTVLSVQSGSLLAALGLLAAALVAGYLAAAQLTEPARLDADDPARAGGLPDAFDTLALRHSVVPLVLGGFLAEVCAIVAAVLSASPLPLLVPVLAVPALVAAALVSAYRGPMPNVAMMGADSPMGNLAPMQMAGWYAAGPLVAVVLLLPPVHVVLGGSARGSGLLMYVLWALAVAGILIWWARRRATTRGKSIRP